MSISNTTTKSARSETATGPKLLDEDAEELRKLDAAVDRIRKVIPETPYILTVPCAEPRYHYPSSQEARSWQKNTLFELHEEHLQYMSFVYREHGDSCFLVRTQVDEERDRRLREQKMNGLTNGKVAALQSSTPKKKISLHDYKSKQSSLNQKPQDANNVTGRKQESKFNGITEQDDSGRPPGTNKEGMANGQKRSAHGSVRL